VSQSRTLGYQIHQRKQHIILVNHLNSSLTFTAEGVVVELPKYPSDCRLSHHTLLKVLLNNHSTLIMGRLGRYESNVMTFVRASNYKLIDRAARCIMMLHKGPTYPEVVRKIFEIKQQIREDEPVVIKVVEHFKKREEYK
jgi:N-acetylmuramic acid 6-phosphate etherase